MWKAEEEEKHKKGNYCVGGCEKSDIPTRHSDFLILKI
jgi:hypothetical protein